MTKIALWACLVIIALALLELTEVQVPWFVWFPVLVGPMAWMAERRRRHLD